MHVACFCVAQVQIHHDPDAAASAGERPEATAARRRRRTRTLECYVAAFAALPSLPVWREVAEAWAGGGGGGISSGLGGGGGGGRLVPPRPAHAARFDGVAITNTAPQLRLKVMGHDRSEVFFTVRTTTQFRTLIEAYRQRFGAEVGTVRLTYEGERVAPEQTPACLGMVDMDEMDAIVEQHGC